MADSNVPGYAGKFLRADLTTGTLSDVIFDESNLRKWLGGAGIGMKVLYDEVPTGADWSDPANRLIIAAGPLAGTRIMGSGSFCVVCRGALTNGATSSQSNGFFGAFLRFSGYDGVIVQGKSPKPVWLHIHDGQAELKDAAHLMGLDTFETDDALHKELGKEKRQLSSVCIGPAGEHLVRFAGVFSDKGHAAAHNGSGAVMGSKNLKAIAAERGAGRIGVADPAALRAVATEMADTIINSPTLSNGTYKWGTLNGVINSNAGGWLPVRNYTTNIYDISDDKLQKYGGPYIREHFNARLAPCWACRMHHIHEMTIPDGPMAGHEVEEPEYECFAAWGPEVGVTDVTETILLSDLNDRLGMDTNEAGWVFGLALECSQKGIVTKEMLGGLDLKWGNTDALRALVRMTAMRQGFGDVLADGAMRAARAIGGEAPNMAIHTLKGNTPRGHDHRSRWTELLDTCVTNLGTLETSVVANFADFGVPNSINMFDFDAIATREGKTKGSMQFEDSLGTCRFCTRTDMKNLVRAVQAATGWDYSFEEAMAQGRRVVNLARVFNIKNGIGPELDRPSPRYGSTPVDGPNAGKSIMERWDDMLAMYYSLMGWTERGVPKAETLDALGLSSVTADLAAADAAARSGASTPPHPR